MKFLLLFVALLSAGCASFKDPPTVLYIAPDGEIIGRKVVNLSGGKGRVLFCQHKNDGSDRCLIVKGGWAFWYTVTE